MALIELDLTARPDQTPTAPPPAYRYRLAGLILAVVLVCALGGAAPGGSTLWRYLGAVPPPGGAETQSRLVGDRIYTISGSGGERVTTAFALEPKPHELWTVRYPGRVIGPDDVGFGGVDARQSGGTVLLSDGPATTVVDAATGRIRWQSEVAITPLPGGHVGIAQNQVFRDGTLYDQDSGDPGLLYFSSTGQPHVEPPVRTEVRGIDLVSGDTRWTTALPGSVNVLTSGADLIVVASDRLERIDGGTGAIRRQITLPKIGADRPVGGELVEGMVLIYYGQSGSADLDVVYAPDTFARLWQRATPEVLLDPPVCGKVLCSGPRAALDVLDPATGRTRWRAPATADLDLVGGYVIESHANALAPIRLADPVTGAVRVDLAGWNAEITGATGSPIMLRKALSAGRSAFGVVLADRDKVQVLGASAGPVSECSSNHAYVLCRGNDGLEIWAYRP
ncbi:PQQ-binding-like beta-propeller repeat protein [Actinoplanes sp. NPDC026619]|uniref:outer membrane protein assembly factor BamB family protein n=1 Tax=Actinoplanes sp. NPDC026619 TaxID=3155798 RepID=UPI003403D30A